MTETLHRETNSMLESNNTAVKAVIDHVVAEGLEIGVQVAAYLDGRLVVDAWGGLANDQTGEPVTADTLFNVFSVSKAINATAVNIQAARGLLRYDAPIAEYWPEFAAHGKGKATVLDALTHRTGVPQMPAGVTPEHMVDWEWMTSRIADLEPLYEVGVQTAYQPMTFGWILGELVRRTDPQRRPFAQFIREEISAPLGITDIWFGVDDEALPRVARLVDDCGVFPPPGSDLYLRCCPENVALTDHVFRRADIQQGCVPAVGGIMNARSEARFWAMLAQRGELDGVRLLPDDKIDWLRAPRHNSGEPDPILFDMPLPLSNGGYWLGIDEPPVNAVGNPRAFCCPGMGGSIGWGDPDNRLAVAICHNRMTMPGTPGGEGVAMLADAVRDVLGIKRVEEKR